MIYSALLSLVTLVQIQDIDRLITELASEDYYSAQRQLVRIGGPAVPALIKSLDSPDELMPQHAAECLGAIGDASAVAPLVRKFRSAEWRDSWEFAAAIGSLRTSECLDALIAALTEGSDADQLGAAAAGIRAYGELAFERVSRLVSQDLNETAATEVVLLLAPLNKRKAVPLLVDALASKSATVRMAACAELGFLGEFGAGPRLVPLLKDKDSGVVVSAIDALGWLGDPANIDSLAGMLTNENEQTVAATVYALGQITDRRVISILEPLRTHKSEVVRDEVSFVLDTLEIWADRDDFARHALISLSTWGESPLSRAYFGKLEKAHLHTELDKRFAEAPKRSHHAIAYAFQLGLLGDNPAKQIARIAEAAAFVEGDDRDAGLVHALDFVGAAVDEILIKHPSADALAAAFRIDADGHLAEEIYDSVANFTRDHVELALAASALVEEGEDLVAESLCYAALFSLSDYLAIDRLLRQAEAAGSSVEKERASRIRLRWERLLDE